MRIFALVLFAGMIGGCGSFGETGSGGGADASVPSADAAPAEAAAGPASCTGPLLFEDDFVRNAPAGNGWAPLAGSPRIDPSAGSPAPSLLAFADVQPDGQKVEHVIGRTVSIAPDTQLCIELDALIQADPVTFTGTSYAELLSVNPSTGASVFVEMRSAGLSLVPGGDTPLPIQRFAFGAWQHLVLRLRFGGGDAELDVGGVIARKANALPEVPATVDIHLGLGAEGRGGQAGATRFLVDNVRATKASL